jgi:CRISPR/Cas system CSM-associated protein Csm3 (group 7 of RAMP superfamily)
MITAQLVIHCDSEWLVAGGDSTVGTADLAPMLDADALPFIPGRTLRGLLREAVTQVGDAIGGGSRHADRLFGTRKTAETTDAVQGDGSVRIGDALLPQAIADQCMSASDRRDLVATIRRTALERETRSAKQGSLREMEVAIAGLQLAAIIECQSKADLALLAFASGLVRSFGHSRSRGLGRCHLTLSQDGKQIDCNSLPAEMAGGAR